MLTVRYGDIFISECSVLVVTTNCQGPMGKGLAKLFRDRYIGLETRYKALCQVGHMGIGKLWLWYGNSKHIIMAFPTKTLWELPSELQYVEDGLTKFIGTYEDKKITSIAFPLLGTGLGGLDSQVVLDLMVARLSPLPITIEIWIKD